MKTGDLITVAGKAGEVTARVLDLRAADDMPALPVMESAEACAVIGEECRRVAIIGYRFGPERIPVVFVALEDKRGTWMDLRGHQLSITPADAAKEKVCEAR